MGEKLFKVSYDDFNRLVEKLLTEYRVIAPVAGNGKPFFAEISSPGEVFLKYKGHVLIPPKRFFFPEKETLFKYFLDGDKVEIHDELEKVKKSKNIILGLRPCDLKGILFLDKVFTKKYKDPYYLARRENTVIVALTCNEPEEYCFCVFTGSGPYFKEGADLLLTDLGDGFLVEVVSEKGSEIVKFNSDLFKKAGEDAESRRKSILRKVREEIERQRLPDFEKVHSVLREEFSNPVWETYGNICLSCGKCNFVCPTCHCFNVYDEPGLDLKTGERVRVWDSCHYLTFTKVASGEIFRKERPSRLKQRIYHKLLYTVDEFGVISCVGCGRCIEVCSAGIDIRKVVMDVTGGGR